MYFITIHKEYTVLVKIVRLTKGIRWNNDGVVLDVRTPRINMVQMGIDMTPLKKGVFTLGYGDLEPKKFFEKIAAADLTILIDVRSSPNTERFNKRMMEIRVGSKYKSIPRLGGKEYSPAPGLF